MKKIILLLVLALGFVFTSCKKDNPEPNEPTPTTQSSSTSDELVIMSTITEIDSVEFEGQVFEFSPTQDNSCSGVLLNTQVFTLASPIGAGTYTLKLYHPINSAYVDVYKFMDDGTDFCEQLGGTNKQLESSGITTTTVTVQ